MASEGEAMSDKHIALKLEDLLRNGSFSWLETVKYILSFFPIIHKWRDKHPKMLALASSIIGGIIALFWHKDKTLSTLRNVRHYVFSWFMAEVTMHGTDEGFDAFYQHLSNLRPRNFATSYIAYSVFEQKRKRLAKGPKDQVGIQEDKQESFDNEQVHRFECEEVLTWEYFLHKGLPVYLERRPNDSNGKGKIVLKWLRGTKTSKSILADAEGVHVKAGESITMIRRAHNGCWTNPTNKAQRSIDSVTIEATAKERLLKSIDLYTAEDRAAWCGAHGTPYRTGYLFYGPPGTGKTSCALALAGYTKRDIYMMSLNDAYVDDTRLVDLLRAVPKRAIILFEDIDSAGITREADDEEDDDDSDLEYLQTDDASEDENEQPKSRVTLSGLLNAIDGPDAPEGHIIIMTTNHRDRLDPALLRSGRCDNRTYFGLASKTTAKEMFIRLMQPSVESFRSGDQTNDDIDGQETIHREELGELANRFAAKIPDSRFSPADLLTFLKSYFNDPSEAVSEVDECMARTIADWEAYEQEKILAAEKRRKKREERRKRAQAQEEKRRQEEVRQLALSEARHIQEQRREEAETRQKNCGESFRGRGGHVGQSGHRGGGNLGRGNGRSIQEGNVKRNGRKFGKRRGHHGKDNQNFERDFKEPAPLEEV